MSCNHKGRTCCRTCGEEVFRDPDVTWERRMSNLLDTVENPGSIPEGAPGSLHRRAWELGQRLKTAVEGGNTRTNLHGGFVDADGKVDKSGRVP